MCERAVETRSTLFFEDVRDYFVTPKMVELCEYAIAEEEKEEEQEEEKEDEEEEWVNQDRV